MNAEILSVGTELLLGGTVNTDARDISLALAELGVNVYWHTVVGDNPARLTECLYRARNRADLIITTGGLGPTCDDLTKQTLARAFDRKLYLNEDALADIREYFAERGRSFTDNNLQQAYLPREHHAAERLRHRAGMHHRGRPRARRDAARPAERVRHDAAELCDAVSPEALRRRDTLAHDPLFRHRRERDGNAPALLYGRGEPYRRAVLPRGRMLGARHRQGRKRAGMRSAHGAGDRGYLR